MGLHEDLLALSLARAIKWLCRILRCEKIAEPRHATPITSEEIRSVVAGVFGLLDDDMHPQEDLKVRAFYRNERPYIVVEYLGAKVDIPAGDVNALVSHELFNKTTLWPLMSAFLDECADCGIWLPLTGGRFR